LRLTRQFFLVAGLVVVLLGLALAIAAYLPYGVDWRDTFRPAALAMLSFRNPYAVEGFYYPLWCLLPYLPFAWLPESIGRGFNLMISLIGFGYVAYRLGAKPLILAAFLASPPVLHCLLNANIDWIPLLGVVLPPQIGLFLVVVKPQVGFGVALFWLVEAWRNGGGRLRSGYWGGLREVLRVFWPVTVALLATFAVFGFWPLRFGHTLTFWWNASLWPASIPVGLALLVAALRRRRKEFALAASPCLSPYVLFHSWSGALVALVSSQAEFIAAVIGLWVLVIIRALGGVGA
jgi:hypothetical protein